MIRIRPPRAGRWQQFRTTRGPATRSPCSTAAAEERILRCAQLVDEARARCLDLERAHSALIEHAPLATGVHGRVRWAQIMRSSERLRHAKQSYSALNGLLCHAISEGLSLRRSAPTPTPTSEDTAQNGPLRAAGLGDTLLS